MVALDFRRAILADVLFLAELNRQLIQDEGHRIDNEPTREFWRAVGFAAHSIMLETE